MPILAATATTVVPPANLFADSRTLDFRRLNGDVLNFDGLSWVPMSGVTGLHMPPREVVRQQLPGLAGSVLQEVRELERPVTIPLFVGSDAGHQTHLQQLATLQSFLDDQSVDYAASSGVFELVVNSLSGERFLRCTYLEGMEGNEGADSGIWWASFGLSLLAVDPYWHGDPWSTPTVHAPDPVGWMSAADGSYTTSWPGQLTSSLAIGANMPVSVTGDVPSWATVEAVGPAATFRAQTSAGLDVSVPGGLTDGERLTIVTNPRGRDVLFNGTRDWSRVAAGDRWQPLAPGTSAVSLTVTGASSATSARLYGDTLWKRAW